MSPRFTIVIPAYNAARHLSDALSSLSWQTRGDWAAVVVDDGSTDGTLDVARAVHDPRIKVLTQPNRGVSAARNRGFEDVATEFVIFLDADDQLLPDALERFATALDADTALAAVYGEGELVDEAGRLIAAGGRPVWNARPSGDVLLPLLRRNFILSGGALCARAVHVRSAGCFREDLRLNEDWEHWCRLAQTGPFLYLGEAPVFRYRRAGEGVVSSIGADTGIAMQNVDAVFDNSALRKRIAPEVLRALRRSSEASVFSFAASQHLKRSDWHAAREMLTKSLRLRPFQPRELLLLAFACLRWLPGPVRARIK